MCAFLPTVKPGKVMLLLGYRHMTYWLTKLGFCRSGKTYTMQGKEEDCDSNVMESSPDMGIVGRAISHIFASIDDMKLSGWNFIASLELVEIYNETLRDLLAPTEVRVVCTIKSLRVYC